MSIIPNCQEYLLNIAQKIIDTFADPLTRNKYYSLKSSLAHEFTISQPSQFTLGTSRGSQSTDKLKKSIALQSSKYTKRQKSRSSMCKSRSKRSTIDMARGRIQTYASNSSQTKKTSQFPIEEYLVLNELATLLKNAESCPTLLKTIKLTQSSINQKINTIISNIEQSLSVVFQNLTTEVQPSRQSLPTDSPSAIPLDEAFADNKWLIGKLQLLISQNTTLRRMVGSKLY